MTSSSSKIIVAFDFGTTYSGAAWVHTAKPEDISLVRAWPNVNGGTRASAKVPSEIVYDPSFTPLGYKWGFEAETHPKKITWVKLLLDESQERRDPALSASMRRIKGLLPPHKKPVDVVTDYLTALQRHTMKCIKRTYGERNTATFPIEYTLTVPAVWSDAAKALTLQAAERAGLGSDGKLRLLAEPEAAAVYTLASIQPNDLKVGHTFVVADCGGGTVDLISYQITQLEPKLEVREHAVGGGLCGSSFINRRFEDWLAARVGIQYRLMREHSRRLLLKEFEELKRSFSTADASFDEIYTCPAAGLDDDEDAGIEDGLLTITKEQMQEILDPVINEVVKLVQAQVSTVEKKGADSVEAILLVGGFGDSEYLRERLEREVKTQKGANIPLLRPINAWTAVVQGAVARSLEGPMISTRLARRHYGTEYCAEYIQGCHPARDKYWCPLRQTWCCRARAQWYIRKGEEVSEGHDIRFPFAASFPESDQQRITHAALYACEKGAAPDTTYGDGVEHICDLECEFSKVPSRCFKKKTNSSGVTFFELRVDIVMNIKSELLVFSVEVDGVKYAVIAPKFK